MTRTVQKKQKNHVLGALVNWLTEDVDGNRISGLGILQFLAGAGAFFSVLALGGRLTMLL